jgi:hypothetical protein
VNGLRSTITSPQEDKYEKHEDAVLVTVDFAGEMEAKASATRFHGVCYLSPQLYRRTFSANPSLEPLPRCAMEGRQLSDEQFDE